ADNSPRIDVKYSVWSSNIEIDYYMEAKNLAENNWKKQSTNTSVNASSLRKRYINTGIGNFSSGRYPNGCILGYVMEGKLSNIVKLLNQILASNQRSEEKLVNDRTYNVPYHYISKHNKTSMPTLKHLMLDFS